MGTSKAVWFDRLEDMDEGQEKNKEWENFWWTIDEDMFTYVMKGRIQELIEQKLNQEFLTEVETRQNEDSESDEEMTSVLRTQMVTQNLIMKELVTIWTLQIWQQIWKQQ